MLKPSLVFLVAALLLPFAVMCASAQDEPLPDAYTLMREVWDAEEKIESLRGHFTSQDTVTSGGGSGHRHSESGEFAWHAKTHYWYRDSNDGSTIAAARERVTRRYSQVLEEFPVTVWTDMPLTFSVDVFVTRWHIERVLRPLHGYLGNDWSQSRLAMFKNATVSRDGELLLVERIPQEWEGKETYSVATKPLPHLVAISVIFGSDTEHYTFDGYEPENMPGTWVTSSSTRRMYSTMTIVSTGINPPGAPATSNVTMLESRTLEIDGDSLNKPLPAELFVVDELNAAYVDYRRPSQRFRYWLGYTSIADFFYDPAYAVEEFEDLFPGVTNVLIAAFVLSAIGMLVLVSFVVRRAVKALHARAKG